MDSNHYWTKQIARRRVLKGAAALTGAAGLGAVLAACGRDGDDGEPTTTPSSGASAAPLNISEFVVANEAEPTDMLPYFGGYGAGLVSRAIYETLFEPRMTLTPDGRVDISYTGVLAKSYTRIDPTRVRYQLREGVKFHNGEAWDAEAASASFEVMSSQDVAASLKKTSYLRGIKLEVVDLMTIDLVFSTPDTESLSSPQVRIGFVGLPPKQLRERGLESFNENPVGTGPFKFASWTRGQEIKLTKFEGYWNKEGTNIPALKFITRPDPGVRALTVRAGEAHFAYNIGGEQAKGLKNKVIGGGFQSSSLRLNNAIAPTNDIRVRKAINHALDREAIAKALFAGTAKPIGFFAFQPVNVQPFKYDLNEAKRLIKEAGVEGQELELVYGENRVPEEPQMVEYYKAQLEAVGLKIKLTRLEARQYNEVGGKPFTEQPPIFMETTSSGNFADNASGLRDKYGCKGSGTFCNPEVDTAVEAMAVLDGEKKITALQKIANDLQNQYTPRAWVVGVQQVHGLAAGVKTDLPLNAYILWEDIRI
jgi:glutathione transport system substrate-binding protein